MANRRFIPSEPLHVVLLCKRVKLVLRYIKGFNLGKKGKLCYTALVTKHKTRHTGLI